ncbi:MAG: nitrilase-related carbon-nitrogen hydrolase [Fimbriimonas sp.]
MRFRVAVAQFAPSKAKVEQNLDRVAEVIRQAAAESVDFVLFPETILSGYFLEGGVLDASLTIAELEQHLQTRLQGEAINLELCLGFYERRNGELYNSAATVRIAKGEVRVIGVYQKFFLATYGVFDEERFIGRGRDLCLLESKLGRIGVLICEDVWHSILPTLTALKGAQILLVPAASPARGFTGETIDNHDRYQRLLRGVAEEHGIFCINAQLVGFEGGKGFLGGSMIIDPFGRMVVEAPLGEEALAVAEIDMDLVAIARSQTPLISDLRAGWSNLRRIANEID